MAGLIHTLVTEGHTDEPFLDRYCTGWPELRDHILREGQSAVWAEEIAGLPTGTLVALARQMAEGRTLVNVSLSVQRADHGEQPYWMAIALAAALGQIGLPGGGFGFPYGANGNVGAGQVRKRVPGLPIPPAPPGMPVIPVSRVTEMLESPGLDYDHDGSRKTYPDIRLVYWCGGNPFHHHQDLNRLGRAWERPETIVVHEPFWTATAKRADIVLPSTTPLERNDLGGAETLLIAMKAAIEPYGEARDDYAIYAALADRLGFGEEFTQGRTVEEWLRHLYDGFAAANAYAPPFDEFWAQGTLVHDMPAMGEAEAVFLAAFRAAPDEAPLPTPSGRIELCSPTIAAFGYDDCPPHPVWLEPYERLGTPPADRHPLHLVSNQPTVRLHSQYDHSDASLATKVAGREPLRMHPTDAAARGIGPDDVVRVFNDRGACLAGAVLSDAVMPGVVQLSTGAWYDPDEDGMCRHGNPNVLTRDKGTSRLAQGPTAHTCLVEVERFEGPPPPVRAFDPPELVDRDGAPTG
jgi:biotin/methionine sulfoxide reductase